MLSHQASQSNLYDQENVHPIETYNMKKHKYTNSAVQTTNQQQGRHNYTMSVGNKGTNRYPTRLIKDKLVTNYEDNSRQSIRE